MKKKLGSFLKEQGYSPIKLRTMKSQHLKVRGMVNGVKANFILDTGASSTVLDYQRAKLFKLKKVQRSEEEAAGIGGMDMLKFECNPVKINMEDYEVKNHEVFLIDLTHVNAALKKMKMRGVDGIIGADILLKYKAVIDYEKLHLYLKSED